MKGEDHVQILVAIANSEAETQEDHPCPAQACPSEKLLAQQNP
jgi:hypothetical protein